MHRKIEEAGFNFFLDSVLTLDEINCKIIPALVHRNSEIELHV